jgi:hypothetical protein
MPIMMPLVELKNLASPKSIASTNRIAPLGVVAARAYEQLATTFGFRSCQVRHPPP